MQARGKNSPGFTLLELLVVLAIVALAMTLLPSFLSAGRANTEMRQEARNLVNALRKTRSIAIVKNRETAFILNLEARSYKIGELGAEQPLGGAVAMELLTAQSEQVGGQVGGIRFYPGGGSSGGEIRLSLGGASQLVTVDWLTGAVRLMN